MKVTPVEGYHSYVKRDGRMNKKEMRESSIRAANRYYRILKIKLPPCKNIKEDEEKCE